MSTKRNVTLLAIVVAALVPAARKITAAPALPEIDLAKACTTYCSICPSEVDHENAIVNEEAATNTGTIHNCGESVDCRYHNGCTQGLMAVNDVWQAVRNKDERALKLALAMHKDLASLNRERSAIQILNCDQDILIAHVPLSKTALESVLSE